MTYGLGIDVGATQVVVAAITDGQLATVPLGDDRPGIAAQLFRRRDGTFLVGDAAVAARRISPGHGVRHFARRLGDPVPLVVGGSSYGAEELTAVFLRHVLAQVAARRKGDLDSLVLAHPAHWSPAQVASLVGAAKAIGVMDSRSLNALEAAAISQNPDESARPGDLVAVYLLGGATFETGICRRTEAGFTLMGKPQGLENLGGADFDQALFAHLRAMFADAIDALDPNQPDAATALARLRAECIKAKETLSTATEAVVNVELPGTAETVTITREQFEAMIEPTLLATVDHVRAAAASAGVAVSDLSAVIVAGGSARLALVPRLLEHHLGRPVQVAIGPAEAIARGAASQAIQHAEVPAPAMEFAAPVAPETGSPVAGAEAVASPVAAETGFVATEATAPSLSEPPPPPESPASLEVAESPTAVGFEAAFGDVGFEDRPWTNESSSTDPFADLDFSLPLQDSQELPILGQTDRPEEEAGVAFDFPVDVDFEPTSGDDNFLAPAVFSGTDDWDALAFAATTAGGQEARTAVATRVPPVDSDVPPVGTDVEDPILWNEIPPLPTVALTSPAAAPYQGPPGPSRSQRPIVVVAVALTMLAAVIGAVWLSSRPDPAKPSPASFAFSPAMGPEKILASRTWFLEGSKGARLRGIVTLVNKSGAVATTSYDEVVPKSVATDVDQIAFRPSEFEVIRPDPIVRFTVPDLAPEESFEITYTVAIAPEGNTNERLERLAADQVREEAEYKGAAAPSVTSLVVTPEVLSLTTGQVSRLEISGTMADGSPAGPELLAGVAWRSDNVNVATVEAGTLTAVGPGTAVITAQLGDIRRDVRVDVGQVVTQPTPPPSSVTRRRIPTTRPEPPRTDPPDEPRPPDQPDPPVETTFLPPLGTTTTSRPTTTTTVRPTTTTSRPTTTTSSTSTSTSTSTSSSTTSTTTSTSTTSTTDPPVTTKVTTPDEETTTTISAF